MTTLLPQVREHINAADFQTVAAFLPPAGEGRTLAVSANEKAVILRGGRVVDMFSGGSKPIQMNDEAVIASLRKYQLVIGFGDCSDSHYNFSPTQIHASSPAFRIADGEEIRSMIVAVSFALDRNDRSNVEKLMAVNAANADAITVSDLAASLPELPQFIRTLIAAQSLDGPSIRTADPDRAAGIERQIMFAADAMLREYGVISDGAALNVIATSRDAELSLPEKDREANAEHLLKLANLHREDGRLERQIQSMEKRLETEHIARQTEMMRTEIMEERLKQSRIQSEIERIDPRMGAASASEIPPAFAADGVVVAPNYAPQADSPPTADRSAYWLNMDAAGVTLHKSACVHAQNSADKPSWKGFSTSDDAHDSTDRAIRKCRDCHPQPGDDLLGAVSIHKAAQEGFTQKALELIAAGVDVNRKDPEGSAPLRYAVPDHPEIAQALIAAGADIHAKGDDGDTPLHDAARIGHTEAADALIAAGSNIHAKNDDGDTPLHIAASNDHMETANALIAAGADIHAKTDIGMTPLHHAAGNGHTETAKALTAAGSDINAAEDDISATPLHFAVLHDHTETADALIAAGADINAKTDTGTTPLQVAALNGHAETAKALIAAGADINVKDDEGRTLLQVAALNGYAETAKALIAGGADINAKGSEGWTFLSHAAQNGHAEMVEALIAGGADINANDSVGWTLLHHAGQNGRSEMADALIAAGADVNANDNPGRTPLHMAAGNGHAETAEALIFNGADVNAKGRFGWMPLHLAARNGHAEAARTLIANGADVNAKNVYSRMPLHDAVESGDTETAQTLIAGGANISVKGEYGWSPLHLAARNGYARMAQTLIVNGADVNAKDYSGNTPLDIADRRRPETVQVIINAGGQTSRAEKSSWFGRLFGR